MQKVTRITLIISIFTLIFISSALGQLKPVAIKTYVGFGHDPVKGNFLASILDNGTMSIVKYFPEIPSYKNDITVCDSNYLIRYLAGNNWKIMQVNTSNGNIISDATLSLSNPQDEPAAIGCPRPNGTASAIIQNPYSHLIWLASINVLNGTYTATPYSFGQKSVNFAKQNGTLFLGDVFDYSLAPAKEKFESLNLQTGVLTPILDVPANTNFSSLYVDAGRVYAMAQAYDPLQPSKGTTIAVELDPNTFAIKKSIDLSILPTEGYGPLTVKNQKGLTTRFEPPTNSTSVINIDFVSGTSSAVKVSLKPTETLQFVSTAY